MACDKALPFLSKSRYAALMGLFGALALAGCVGNSVFDDLNNMEPVGGPFAEGLFKNYSYLARSFGTQSGPSGQAFDAGSAISLTGSDNTISGLANSYAQKALTAGRGDEVLPEPAPEDDADAENVRLELLRDLDDGRDKAPEEAARAQVEYDCWILNRRVDSLRSAAQACRRSVTAALVRLERELRPTTAPPPLPAPVAETPAPAPPPAAAQPAQFSVAFAYRSAALSPDQLAVVGQAIAAARTGRESHIMVVGHTDTAENSQPLSLRRAKAVEEALVGQGARADAIQVSGVGKDDPAVQTPEHVKEPQNRRVVITLVP